MGEDIHLYVSSICISGSGEKNDPRGLITSRLLEVLLYSYPLTFLFYFIVTIFMFLTVVFTQGVVTYLPRHLDFVSRRAKFYFLGSERGDWPSPPIGGGFIKNDL